MQSGKKKEEEDTQGYTFNYTLFFDYKKLIRTDFTCEKKKRDKFLSFLE